MDPLSGVEIEAAAAIITGSEYATPTLKFVMIQLAEPAKTATLTFEGALDVPRCAFVTMYDGGAKLVTEAADTPDDHVFDHGKVHLVVVPQRRR